MVINCLIKPSVKVFSLLFVVILTTKAMALNMTANSCSRSDVASAITTVLNAGGGTVYIPAGDCTWSSGVTVDSGAGGKSISIIGAGQSNTIIRPSSAIDTFTVGQSLSNAPAFFRLSNFSVISTSYPTVLYSIWLQTMRVDHMYIEVKSGSSVFSTKNVAKALYDNNYFLQNGGYNDPCYVSYLIELGECYTPSPPTPANCYSSVCACDIGSTPHYRTSSIASGNTVVARLRAGSSAAANINNSGGSGTGTIKYIYLYLASANTGATVDVGTFSASGNVLTTRGSATGISVKAGLNVLVAGTDFTAFSVHTGDYLGVYLNNCTLASGAVVPDGSGDTGTYASGYWVKSGNQIGKSSVDFSSPQINTVSLWAEIYDTEGTLASCESNWNSWWTNTTSDRVAGLSGYNRAYNADYKPTSSDDQGIFIEDNYIRWTQGTIEGNWGGLQKIIVRHNEFNNPTASCTNVSSQPTSKEGSMFAHYYNNIFNNYSFTRDDISFEGSPTNHINMVGDVNGYHDFRHMFAVGDHINITGSAHNNTQVTVSAISKLQITTTENLTTEAAGNTINLLRTNPPSGGPVAYFYQVNGLVYNNTINNRTEAWNLDCIRYYEQTYTPMINQKHLYIFNNTCNNCSCGTADSLGCTGWEEGGASNGFCSYNGTYFFRAPQSGETLYGYGQYTYPHPLTKGDVSSVPSSPTGLRIAN